MRSPLRCIRYASPAGRGPTDFPNRRRHPLHPSPSTERNFRFTGSADSFVVHVGDVHDAMHLVASQLEMTLKQIFEDVGAKISDVRAAVNGGPTSVDADLGFGGIAPLEFFDLARVSIKKTERHIHHRISFRAERRISQNNGALSCVGKSWLGLRDGSLRSL